MTEDRAGGVYSFINAAEKEILEELGKVKRKQVQGRLRTASIGPVDTKNRGEKKGSKLLRGSNLTQDNDT